MELLIENETRVPARIFYLDREILPPRELERALEMTSSEVRIAAERRRTQRVENPEVAVNGTALVGLVELERAPEHRLDPRQLGDRVPILAGGVEVAEP